MKYVIVALMLLFTACSNKVLVKTKTCKPVDKDVRDVSECEEFNP